MRILKKKRQQHCARRMVTQRNGVAGQGENRMTEAGVHFTLKMCLFFFQGTISVGIDATDLFDRYDEEYEDVPGNSFPQIEINKMHISQSIEVGAGVSVKIHPVSLWKQTSSLARMDLALPK